VFGLSLDLLLSTSTYFVFLFAIFFLYWPLSRVRTLTLAVILFANYFFYAKWDLVYLSLIPAVSSCDYIFGLGLQYSTRTWVRRLLVTASIVMNVGMLALMKYVPFFLENWAHVTGRPAPEWSWTLPLTLSFYVFQALTYTIDIYRRDAKGTKSYLAHLAAVSFFPTIIAGPITRVSSLIDQFEKPKKLDAADGGRALFLIGMGLMKKLLVADFLGANLVNRVFDFPNLYTGAETLIAVYAYALQIYYDFSGYTDIALGSALLLGIKLPQNFNRPYAAENVADFWRRWHITLSNWLRDYLYFSLPGLRSKWKIFTYTNLVITMVIGGLWHGASWNFVIWGALHGIGLAVVRLWQTWTGTAKATGPWKYVNIFITFHFVTFAWVFFRAASFENAVLILSRIASLTVSFANVSAPLVIVLTIGILAHYIPKRWYDFSVTLFVRAPFYAQAAALALLVIGLQYVAQTGATPFIYNRF
jgi:alginate O-acetyltransferase complex protein AlgI